MEFIEWIQSVDLSAVRFVRDNIANEVLDVIFRIITLFGEAGIVPIVLAVVMMFFRKTRKAGIVMGCSLALGFLIGNLALKNIVARPRPYSVDTHIKLIVGELGDYSFPSGHTLATFECAVCLLLNKFKRAGIAALIIAVLVAFSRVYLYVHYPTDVIAGSILGTAFAFASYAIVSAVYSKFVKKNTL